MRPQDLGSIQKLCNADGAAGIVVIGDNYLEDADVAAKYASAAGHLAKYCGFWNGKKLAAYRPESGLWAPQRKAVAFVHAYLAAMTVQHGAGPVVALRESALVKMPTGTGKTAVIAAIACASPLAKRVLVITPRRALVDQLQEDLCFRFWQKTGSVYLGNRLIEGLTQTEIDQRDPKGNNPVQVLSEANYQNIYDAYNPAAPERQIMVGTFNALHLILGPAPPAHKSKAGKQRRDPPRSLNELELAERDRGQSGPEAFKEVFKSLDLVIVDEGHYEPAYTWSQCIQELNRPTVILTATPYRNDYKYFRMEGNFSFNLCWHDAVENGLIRRTKVAPPIGANRRLDAAGNAEVFVDQFARTLAKLTRGRKVIVHASHFDTLRRLQVAFDEKLQEEALLIHDQIKGDRTKHSDDLFQPGMPSDRRDRLSKLRFQKVREAIDCDRAKPTRVWLHQFKLLEGIDDHRFVEVWLYDSFGSARQLVQQIGRASRLPKESAHFGAIATIRSWAKPTDRFRGAPTSMEVLQRRWNEYLAYESYAKKDNRRVFTAETQLLSLIAQTAPESQYIMREFRGGHFVSRDVDMTAFMVPRRATVFRLGSIVNAGDRQQIDVRLNHLQTLAVEAMLLEERYSIEAIPPPDLRVYEEFRDCRLIRYYAWENSPYLVGHSLPEWRLGLMLIAFADPYIFLLDTESICLDPARAGLIQPQRLEFKRLFTEPASSNGDHRLVRIVEATAAGLDLNELAIRSVSIRKHNLEDGYFDLAEASQAPTAVAGLAPLDDRSTRRRISLRKGRISDATSTYLRLDKYVRWARSVAGIMADQSVKPATFFNRFAQELEPLSPTEAAPRSILLDLWDILNIDDEVVSDRRWRSDAINSLLEFDTCIDVEESPDTPGLYLGEFKSADGSEAFELEIRYEYKATVPPSARYHVSCTRLNGFVAVASSGDGVDAEDRLNAAAYSHSPPTSLTSLLNQEQSFRIVPQKPGAVYANTYFFAPRLNLDALSRGEPGTPLDIVEPSPHFSTAVSEKGNTRLNRRAEWGTRTLFGKLHATFGQPAVENTPFAQDLAACTLFICDDDNREICDFFAVSDRKILMIHAKAADTGAPTYSARSLQEVSRQTQTSLAFVGSAGRDFAMPPRWRDPLEIPMEFTGGTTDILRRDRIWSSTKPTPDGAFNTLVDALRDPGRVREVVLLSAGLLSKSAAQSAFKAPDEIAPGALQFIYYLAGLQTTFSRAGVRLRIIANP